MKFHYTLLALLSLLAYVNGQSYDHFTTTLSNQTPACSAPVDAALNACVNVCGKYVKYTAGTGTNAFTFTEYSNADCSTQVNPAVTNNFVCGDETTSHSINTNWSTVCKLQVTPTPSVTPSVTPTVTPTPTPSTPSPTPTATTGAATTSSTTTGSASTVAASLSLIIFSMILALC
ncbi:hypothetical protein RB653_007652 [Dictyostelium firmibasis]|uniref:Uncharacterized protein n=1 Tax=Dictyostelium firmibasis TaxID=79012 RepID=A0AAN7TVR9_9MYCE